MTAIGIRPPRAGLPASPRSFPAPAPDDLVPTAALPSSPRLVVVVDTEEEFDWHKPVARTSTAVSAMAGQHRAQAMFDSLGIVPTYVVDYPVASNGWAVGILKEFHADGRCLIGAHLHPWVNPPHEERVSSIASYPGNLPARLEREKLTRLRDAIGQAFGEAPTIYKAGRYGLGAATAEILGELGFMVDVSVVPYTSFATDGGPDFRAFTWRPFRFGPENRLLAIPLSCGFAGALRRHGHRLYPVMTSAPGMVVRAPAVFARTRTLERIRLTPEGVNLAALLRLTRSLLADGCTILHLTYHSPSLVPGHTPYVRTERDLERFLDTLTAYCRFVIEELKGRPTTPLDFYHSLASGDVAA